MDPSDKKTCCGICKKAIYENCVCIHCVNCQQWVHTTCNNLNRNDVKKLDLQTFVCKACMQDEDVKSESDSDGEFEEFEGYEKYSGKISAIERTRLESIKRNREMFEECDIKEAKEEMSVKKQKSEEVVGLVVKREKKDWVSLPRRKSLRIQNVPPGPLKEVDIEHTDKDKNHVWDERKPKEMDMKCINGVEDGIYELAVKSWLKDDAKSDSYQHSDYNSYDVSKYKEKISSLSVSDIARLTEKRGFSIAWYPSKTKKVICMGSVNGSIGIWDIDRSKEKDCVFVFGVHSRPVSCLTFSPFDQSKIYSCSYDGTLTCGDLNQLNFSRKYSDEDYGTYFYHFSFPYQQRNTLLLGNSAGEVLTFDQTTGKIVQTFKLHNERKRGARCVDCHPLNENLIVTSLSDGTLSTWDLRYIDGPSKSLSSFKAAKTIVKSFFSPSGNKVLMTSQDHYLRVFDVNEAGEFRLPPRHQIKHENYYGRYLTTFRATWDPKTDHSFICGSMAANPRRVDMFGCDDKKQQLLSYTLRDERLTTITSLNVFHPSLDLIASANSTGKVYVWS